PRSRVSPRCFPPPRLRERFRPSALSPPGLFPGALRPLAREGKTQILDVIRERKPPFSPEAVVDEFTSLMKQYRVSKVYGDRYGGEWPREQFNKRGIFYEPAEKPKSDLYRDLLPLINSRAVGLLGQDKMVTQLLSLERRTSRGGKDSIDHAPGAHDDIANAVAGALVTAFKDPGIANFRRPINYPKIRVA